MLPGTKTMTNRLLENPPAPHAKISRKTQKINASFQAPLQNALKIKAKGVISASSGRIVFSTFPGKVPKQPPNHFFKANGHRNHLLLEILCTVHQKSTQMDVLVPISDCTNIFTFFCVFCFFGVLFLDTFSFRFYFSRYFFWRKKVPIFCRKKGEAKSN